MRAVRRRDVAAHRALFDRYYRGVFAVVHRRVRDAGLAEEVVADVFLEVWRGASSYRGNAPVASWIFGIAHFKARSADRRRRRLKRSAVVPTNVEILHKFSSEADPTADLESREELHQLLQAMDGLPASQREVLRLAFVEGWSYQQIAERLGVSEGTVKTRISRGRARLRAQRAGVFAGDRT